MRVLAGLILLAHGIAHIVGFVVPWRLSKTIPYDTRILGGRADLGDAGAKVLGVVWLLLAIDFGLIAWGAFTQAPWWGTGALITACVSLLLCIVGWPDARVGAFVNLAIIAVALAARMR